VATGTGANGWQMARFLEFMSRHPLLVGSIAILAIVAVVIELRHRKSGGAAVSPADAVLLMNAGALVLDVRAADAYAGGHIIDSRNIASADLASQADSLKKYREKPVILCCDTGVTSGGAAATLKSLGFAKVVNLRGGLSAWKQENLPLVTAKPANKGGKTGKTKGG
jgi:rhodanese-related sulfurtransferase